MDPSATNASDDHVPTSAEIAADAEWRHGIVHNVRKVYFGIGTLYLTFIVVTALWFAQRTRTDASLAKRSVLLTMIGFLGNFFISFPFLGLQSTDFPCFLILTSLYLGVACTIFSLSARAWRLRYLFRSHQDKLARMKSMETAGKPVDIDHDIAEEIKDSAEEEDDMLEPLGQRVAGSQALTLIGSTMGSTNLVGSTIGGSMLGGSTGNMDAVSRGHGRSSSGFLARGSQAQGSSSNGGAGYGKSASALATPSPKPGNGRAIVGQGAISAEASHAGPRRVSETYNPKRSDHDAFSAAEEGHGARSTLTNRGHGHLSFSKRITQTSIINPTFMEEPTKRLLYILLAVIAITLTYTGVVMSFSRQYGLVPVSYKCQMGSWEMVPVLISFGSFLLIGCPALCWWLWNDKDTYGIRRDLTVFAIAGTGVGMMYSLEQALVPTGKFYGESTLRLYFGASNWPVIGVAVGHFTSVFFPLLSSYGIHPLRPFSRLFQRLKRSASRETTSDSGSNEKLEAEKRKRDNARRERRQRKGGSPAVTWTLFQSVLEDGECFEAFKDFAARDFAAENPLFYQEYKKLMEKVRIEQGPTGSDQPFRPTSASFLAAQPSARRMSSVPVIRGISQLEDLPGPLNREMAMSHDSVTNKYPVFDFSNTSRYGWKARILSIVTGGYYAPSGIAARSHNSLFNFGSRSQPMLLAPPVAASEGGLLIPAHLREDYRTLYRTFISSGAPLQISLSARVTEEIAKQVGEESKVLPLVSVFDEARNEVLGFMFEMFPRFMEAEKEGVVKKFLKIAAKEFHSRSRRPTQSVPQPVVPQSSAV
ncbi:hypothetical protein DFJ77DRAFT_308205 [Powellomyces hirtus]|nr:hypothetical protein DFJ77DRAFT_308205 [Powellomyces hirtus]